MHDILPSSAIGFDYSHKKRVFFDSLCKNCSNMFMHQVFVATMPSMYFVQACSCTCSGLATQGSRLKSNCWA